MAARIQFDWETIHKEYRSGTFSLSEIAKRHGCSRAAIRKQARKGDWQQDLTEEVRRATNAKMVALDAKVPGSVPAYNATEVVEQASEARVAVVQSHRRDIRALAELEKKLIAELDGNPTKLYLAQYQGQIIEKEVGLTAAERAMAANNLANVQHKRIQLERQAFNIDGNIGRGETVDEITINFVSPGMANDSPDSESK